MAITHEEAEKKWGEKQKQLKILEKEELENFKKQGENFFDEVITNKINILKKKKIKIRCAWLYFTKDIALESDNLILCIPDKYIFRVFYYLKEKYKETGWMISCHFPYLLINIKKIN